MSYTYLQEQLTIKQNSVLLRDEKMHSMPNGKRNFGIQKINSRPIVFMVQTMREGIPTRNIQKKPIKTERESESLDGKICSGILCETKNRKAKILCFGNCEKIQNIQTRSSTTNRHRRINVQGVRNLFRYDEASSSQELRSLSHNRKNTRVSLLSM
jgi:hypothetical protein